MMSKTSKELRGYIKTESVMLIVFIALAVGFVGGVAYSAYRSSSQMTTPMSSPSAAPPLNDQQRAQLAELIKRTESNPQDGASWSQLGHLYFDTGQLAPAIEAYRTSLALDSRQPDIWTDLGVMYRRNGEPQKAIESFDQALKINQHHEIALFNKGVVLMHDLSDSEGAISAWETLLQHNPQANTPGGQSIRELVDQLKKLPPK